MYSKDGDGQKAPRRHRKTVSFSVSDWLDKDIASVDLSDPETSRLPFFRNVEKAMAKRRGDTFVPDATWSAEVISLFDQLAAGKRITLTSPS